MNKVEKKQVVESLRQSFSEAGSIVVTHYKGLTVADITLLRKGMREAGAEFKVVKNSLTKLALEGTKYEKLADMFVGPVAIALSNDPVAAAKGVVDFANDNENLVILGGAVGDEAMDIKKIKELSKLPSMDVLRAKILGMISTPASRVACVLQAPGSQVARVIGAYAAKEE